MMKAAAVITRPKTSILVPKAVSSAASETRQKRVRARILGPWTISEGTGVIVVADEVLEVRWAEYN